MYLDTDVILAHLKPDDWLASSVDVGALTDPKTSISTTIEVQYVMESEWSRNRVTRTHEAITGAGIDFVPMTFDIAEVAGELRRLYERLNVFDSIHLGTAVIHDEPVVSTDTLYPDIDEIEHVDP